MLFNPSYEPLSDECVEEYEGCLSVVTLLGKVSRYKYIRYRGYDTN
ncbi:MAG: peptide deformylase [Legionella sp.]|nr:peptide deformylase [Legionella sp.]